MERKGQRGLEREREKEILFRIERVSIGISMATISRRSSYFYLEINGCGCSRIYVSNWVSVTCFAPSVSLKGIKPSSSRFKFNSTRIRTRRMVSSTRCRIRVRVSNRDYSFNSIEPLKIISSLGITVISPPGIRYQILYRLHPTVFHNRFQVTSHRSGN